MGKTFICINIDETLQTNLASLDCDIVNALSCQEAKSLMSQVSPDLVIIAADKEQPTMDLTPIKDLKTTADTACLPVLFVTQKNDKLLQKKILEAGVNDFIEVPVDFEELKLRIKNYARISERRNAVMTENQTLKKELSLKNSEIKTSNYTIKEAKLDGIEEHANYITKVSQLINDAGYQTEADLQAAIEKIIGEAPEVLDTLKEIADALGNDPNFATTITKKLAAITEQLNQEITNRTEADAQVQANVDKEVSDRKEADTALEAKLKEYVDNEVDKITGNTDGIQASLNKEIQDIRRVFSFFKDT